MNESTMQALPAKAVAAWQALREHLTARSRALNEEVRRYPTPIARCDEQLPKLLEQRAQAVRLARLAEAADEASRHGPRAERLKHLAGFLDAARAADDDEVEDALRRRLAEALAAEHPMIPT